LKTIITLLTGILFCELVTAQAITGFWRGKTGKGLFQQKVEVKLILKGDSIAGTAYYYESKNKYARYSVKGYFNMMDNTVVWWDDALIENKLYRKQPQLSEADFNCPGEGVMRLDGITKPLNGDETAPTHLQKMAAPVFADEWDEMIAGYTIGSNNPYLIDSVANIAFTKRAPAEEIAVTSSTQPVAKEKQPTAPVPEKVIVNNTPGKPLTTEDKFNSRKKELTKEIEVVADSIIINFYDNAEIDGDTISIYLDNRLLYRDIRLSDRAFTIRLAKNQLQPVSELVMVAENLGSIPPNTSYMSATCGEKTYEAFLASTVHSSALIRLKKTGQ
jgi:hypothetical protein